ncbi:MAG: RIP metalloprotease RseP [Chitinophagales bacterium]
MEQLTMIGQLLLGLGLLVFIHELGHYLAARAFGIKVEKFYIFFDFGGLKLFSKKIGDTEYGIGWFPLGGYVKIAGMIDESMDKDQMDKEPEPWEFRTKPAWQRLIVMMAGIVMNVLLGIVIFAFWLMQFKGGYMEPSKIEEGIYAYEIGRDIGLQTGDQILSIDDEPVQRADDLLSLKVFFGEKMSVLRNGKEVEIQIPENFFQRFNACKTCFIGFHNHPFYIDSIIPEGGAKEAGIKPGDDIISFNDQPIRVYGDLKEILRNAAGKEAEITYVRDNDTIQAMVPVSEDGKLGVFIGENVEHQPTKYNLAEALYFGTKDGWEAIYFNAVGIGKIFTGQVSASESVQSPIGIAKIYGSKWDWARFWKLTGLISFILAFMNFLPIPALDGGHVVFILIEMIQGKPVSEAVMEKAQMVGMVILLTLMVFAFGNDIYKGWFK